MREEQIIMNLADIAVEKDRISDEFTNDKWKSMTYSTKFGQGKMLLIPQDGDAENVTLKINLDGYYKIYVGQIVLRGFTYTYTKLSGDEFFTGIKGSTRNIPCEWGIEESLMEVFWKCADMTNQNIIIGRPHSFCTHLSNIAWFRFVPMTDEEIDKFVNAKYDKILQTHFDEDIYVRDPMNDSHGYLYTLSRLNEKNIDFCTQEISFDYDNYEPKDFVPLRRKDKEWSDLGFKGLRIKKYEDYIDYAHKKSMKIFAGNRMSVANFTIPYTIKSWNMNFVDENPQYYCLNRDKTVIKVCSYAYDEVQDFVIKNLIEKMKYGFDGLTMDFHRGTHIGFEKPVIDRVKELYPNVDPYTLPFEDERLHGVWCEFMTRFMRKMRKALDEMSDRHLEINVILSYGLKESLNIGLNAEEWAKEGLIDRITQSDMETFEDLTDCMSEENPELIDLEKYKKQICDRAVVTRRCGTNIEKVCKYIKDYADIEEKYGVQAYCMLPWEGSVPPDKYDDVLDELRKHGAKRFFRWNANQIIPDIAEWNIVREIGNHDKIKVDYKKFYRVLELDGSDISQFNPNWRG